MRGGCGSDQVAIRGKSLELARLLEASCRAPDRDRSQPRWSDRAVIERVPTTPCRPGNFASASDVGRDGLSYQVLVCGHGALVCYLSVVHLLSASLETVRLGWCSTLHTLCTRWLLRRNRYLSLLSRDSSAARARLSGVTSRRIRTTLAGVTERRKEGRYLPSTWSSGFSWGLLAVYSCALGSVGPVSSLHDRACELFYSLVGGTGEHLCYRR